MINNGHVIPSASAETQSALTPVRRFSQSWRDSTEGWLSVWMRLSFIGDDSLAVSDVTEVAERRSIQSNRRSCTLSRVCCIPILVLSRNDYPKTDDPRSAQSECTRRCIRFAAPNWDEHLLHTCSPHETQTDCRAPSVRENNRIPPELSDTRENHNA